MSRTKTDYRKKSKEKRKERTAWGSANKSRAIFFDQLEVEPKCDFGNMTLAATQLTNWIG